MNVEQLIHKYYESQPELEEILLSHSRDVAHFSLEISQKHPELQLDEAFLYDAAMLHDIGIIQTNAVGIKCYGTEPYICHGMLGGRMLRQECLPLHARVAERHTGTGLTKETIIAQQLPLPIEDWSPETVEEQVICYADKFFSKSRLGERKSIEKVLSSLEKFGHDGIIRFNTWHRLFSIES